MMFSIRYILTNIYCSLYISLYFFCFDFLYCRYCLLLSYRRLWGESNREIVSIRSCVRASEAACAREAMCSLSLGRRTSRRAPVRSGPLRSGPVCALPPGLYAPHTNKVFRVFGEAWGSVRCASLSELRSGEALASQFEEFLFAPL